MIKLSPKNIKLCPNCKTNNIKEIDPFNFFKDIKLKKDNKKDNKIISLKKENSKNKNSLF